MRFTARVFFRCISFFLLFTLVASLFSPVVLAQTTQTETTSDASDYALPNAEANVAKNQHTLIQSVLIEMLLAIGCQLTGIDLASPQAPCLGINPATNKLGYSTPPSQDGQLQVGGLLGTLGNGIAYLYTPTVTTTDYTRYLAENFGIAKKAIAAPQNSFEGLSPVRNMWIATRDISYFLLILAFVFIGIGVMLRIKIDPRTVMTVQNQIPRVIIAIILITFSYAIAAVMIDLMWTSTYVIMNVMTNAANPEVKECHNVTVPLSQTAANNLLSSPFSYANRLFIVDDCDLMESGLLDLSKGVANAITALERDSLMSFLGLNPTNTCSFGDKWWDYTPVFAIPKYLNNLGDIGDCLLKGPIGNFMAVLTSIIWMLIIFIILIITFFRIWFELLKAYAMILLYTILAPLFIVINLLPKRPLGFERWIRVFFANLAIFPATVAMLVLARIFVEEFSKPGLAADPASFPPLTHALAGPGVNVFVPPLVGNPNMKNFGVIIGFAIILLIPQLISLLREKLGVPPVKQTAAIGAAFSAGTSAAGAPPAKIWKHLNRRNPQTGAPMGVLARWRSEAGKKTLRAVGGKWGAKQAAQQEHVERTGQRARNDDDLKLAGIDTRSRSERRADRNAKVTDEQYITQEQLRVGQKKEQHSVQQQEAIGIRPVEINVNITAPDGKQTMHRLAGAGPQTVSEFVQSQSKDPAADLSGVQNQIGANWNKKLADLNPTERNELGGTIGKNQTLFKLPPPEKTA